jgi:hypothetical protein
MCFFEVGATLALFGWGLMNATHLAKVLQTAELKLKELQNCQQFIDYKMANTDLCLISDDPYPSKGCLVSFFSCFAKFLFSNFSNTAKDC